MTTGLFFAIFIFIISVFVLPITIYYIKNLNRDTITTTNEPLTQLMPLTTVPIPESGVIPVGFYKINDLSMSPIPFEHDVSDGGGRANSENDEHTNTIGGGGDGGNIVEIPQTEYKTTTYAYSPNISPNTDYHTATTTTDDPLGGGAMVMKNGKMMSLPPLEIKQLQGNILYNDDFPYGRKSFVPDYETSVYLRHS